MHENSVRKIVKHSQSHKGGLEKMERHLFLDRVPEHKDVSSPSVNL